MRERDEIMKKLLEARLYGIVDTGYVARERFGATAEELCAGGVDVIQFRAKNFSKNEILLHAKEIATICQKYGVPFIINDFPDIAVATYADGVHIGQDDGSLAEVREIVGTEMIVGRSTHSYEQAVAAMDEGFDYIGFGPLFPTPTKLGRPGIGMAEVQKVQAEVGEKIPVFCIGGIKEENLTEVMAAGARRVVIVSSILQAANISAAAARVKNLLVS